MRSAEGTWKLVLFFLRRDRTMLLWWIAGGVVLYVSQGVSTDGIYTSQAELDKAAQGMESNVAFIAMAGPARALNTVGGQVAWQAAAFGAVVAGLMSMFLIGRHTRGEEESGRDEMVRAGRIGRHAPMSAAALECLMANTLLGASVAGSLIAYGLPAAGSIALGVAVGEAGVFFGAVTLVAVQLSQSTRGAYAVTGAAMALAYVLRAIGDVGNGILSWASPIGWGQYLRAYASEQWWPAVLTPVAVIPLAAVALRLFDHRDFGSGIWATKRGPARGRIHTSLGLAWRLQKGAVIGWTGGLLLGGIAFGSIGDDVNDLLGDSSFTQDTFGQATGGSFVDSFYAVLIMMLALIGAGFAIGSVLRLRSEESAKFAELQLATGEPRWRWATSHLTVMALRTVLVVGAGGLGMGAGFALVTGDASALPRLAGATLPYVAPDITLAAVTWVAFAIHPSLGGVGWLTLGFCLVVMMFGPTLQLPGWVMSISPFEHMALAPAEALHASPVLALLAISAALGASGMVALRHRDMG